MRRIPLGALAALAFLFAAVQLVPYGRAHSNPPVVSEPNWSDRETRQLAVRYCYDCHSNETGWSWYSNIAPMSWLIQRHVDEGREKLNFSEWNRPQEEADESAETVREGGMPPWSYLLPKGQLRLSSAEAAALIRGLEATLGSDSSDEDDRREDRGRRRGRD